MFSLQLYRTCGSVVMGSHRLFVLALVQRIKFLLSGKPVVVVRLNGGEGEEKPVQLFTNSP